MTNPTWRHTGPREQVEIHSISEKKKNGRWTKESVFWGSEYLERTFEHFNICSFEHLDIWSLEHLNIWTFEIRGITVFLGSKYLEINLTLWLTQPEDRRGYKHGNSLKKKKKKGRNLEWKEHVLWSGYLEINTACEELNIGTLDIPKLFDIGTSEHSKI